MIARFEELIRYRELMKNLVIRDLKVRYKNSALGVLWSLLNPLLMTLVFTFVFTIMLETDLEDFAVFFLCGFLPWSFLSTSVTGTTASIVGNAHLIKKVYFPREILPISEVLANLVNFLLALVVLFAMILISGRPLTLALLLLPLIIVAQVILVLGLSLLLATLNVFYRDTQHLLEPIMTAWFFLTPVFYPIGTLPDNATLLGITVDVELWARRLNPMASLIASYRDVLYWGSPTGIDFFLRTLATCVLVLLLGYVVFCRFSATFGEEA
ncbi:MAG: ABC transporter permease [Anaerolineae bacterium]|jgi:ABC-type polysaccharide/polyol phosphate export permease